MSHNRRTSADVKYINGDLVYFKRKSDTRWHGPGYIIGQCGQFTLIRHQCSWIRVQPCQMQMVEREEKGVEIQVEGNNQKMLISNNDKDLHEKSAFIPNIPEDETGINYEVRENSIEKTGEVINVAKDTKEKGNSADSPDEQQGKKKDTEKKGNSVDSADEQVKKLVKILINKYNKVIKCVDMLKPGRDVKFKLNDGESDNRIYEDNGGPQGYSKLIGTSFRHLWHSLNQKKKQKSLRRKTRL